MNTKRATYSYIPQAATVWPPLVLVLISHFYFPVLSIPQKSEENNADNDLPPSVLNGYLAGV